MVTTPLFLTHGYGPPNGSINPCLQARIFNKDLYNYLFGRLLQYSAIGVHTPYLFRLRCADTKTQYKLVGYFILRLL